MSNNKSDNNHNKNDTKTKKYEFAVVGNGLIGSAAGRYLSEWSDSVVIIGPSEEAAAAAAAAAAAIDASDHNNSSNISNSSSNNNQSAAVFSSHYDQGRLYNANNSQDDPIWNAINHRAVMNYTSLEERSGISFHNPVGQVSVARRSLQERKQLLNWIERNKEKNSSRTEEKNEFLYFEAGDRSWKDDTHLSMFEFPIECDILYQGPSTRTAGIVNPRQLIAAQNVISQQQQPQQQSNKGGGKATIIDQVVINIASTEEEVILSLANGDIILADKVLIACGAFTNFNHLLPKPIPLRYKTETTLWGTVSNDLIANNSDSNNLKYMPTVCYDIIDNREEEEDPPVIDDLYMAPPLLYPDGTYKIKMGCNTINESWPTTLEDIQQWFLHGNSDADLPAMVQTMQSLLPKVPFHSLTTHRCIVTYTPSGYPTIDVVPSDNNNNNKRLYVATGGNGASAQGSDTLGHLAAGLIYDGRWIYDAIPRDLFRATNQWERRETSPKKLSNAQRRAMAL